MHSRILLALLVLICGGSALAQPFGFKLMYSRSGNSEMAVEFTAETPQWRTLSTAQGSMQIPMHPQAARLLQKGAPDVISFATSLLIPDSGKCIIDTLYGDYYDIEEVELAPSLGNLMRNERPDDALREKGTVYSEDAFFPKTTALLRQPYRYRNFRANALVVYPIQYNPVRRVCRIYRSLYIRIRWENSMEPEVPRSARNPSILPEDHEMLARHFLNFPVSRYEIPEEAGTMLILSPAAYFEVLQPFVNWKKQTGMPVEVRDVSSLGTADVIAEAIREAYQNTNLKYVILVGDADQVPTQIRYGAASDPSYGCIEGDDAYPEVWVGRFSVETPAQAASLVQRILEYEQAVSGDHFNKNIGIGSDQGPGDANEMDFEHIRNMQSDLLGFTYTQGSEFFDGSQSGLDAPGNPDPSDIAESLEQGAGLVLYTGHGSATSFSTSGFSNAHVNQLNNTGKLPLIWSVACMNGAFTNETCLAEAWTRASMNGHPTGATTVFMASVNQSWDPPMCAQDEMVDVLCNLNASNVGRNFGSVSLSGCMKMNDVYGEAGAEMTASWHIFGDPSLAIRTREPMELLVTHPDSMPFGTNALLVQSPVEGAKIALVQEGEILATGFVAGGHCALSFNPISSLASVQLTATAFNYSPYVGLLSIQMPNTPYFTLQSAQINDLQGNGNGFADNNEQAWLQLEVHNVGTPFDGTLTGMLEVNSEAVALLNPDTFCDFQAQDAIGNYVSINCFELRTASGITDGTVVHFLLTLTDSVGNFWQQTFPLILHAPRYSAVSYELTELNGNGNGRADAGETLRIRIPCLNSGSSDGASGFAQLSSSNLHVFPLAFESLSDAIPAGQSRDFYFDWIVSESVPSNTVADFVFTAQWGEYPVVYPFALQLNAIVEDAENGMDAFSWSSESPSPWFIDATERYEGTSSFRSGTIANAQQTELRLHYSVAQPGALRFYRKISSETGYDFLRFYIDGQMVGEWSGQLPWSQVSFDLDAGIHELVWVYEKDNMLSAYSDAAWIDYITFPDSASFLSMNAALPANQWEVFPNPAASRVDVRVNDWKPGEALLLRDLSGRVLARYSILQQWETLNLPECISAGVYVLERPEYNTHKKLLIQP